MKRRHKPAFVGVHVTLSRAEAEQLLRRVRSARSNAWTPKDAALLAIAILKLEEAIGDEEEVQVVEQP